MKLSKGKIKKLYSNQNQTKKHKRKTKNIRKIKKSSKNIINTNLRRTTLKKYGGNNFLNLFSNLSPSLSNYLKPKAHKLFVKNYILSQFNKYNTENQSDVDKQNNMGNYYYNNNYIYVTKSLETYRVEHDKHIFELNKNFDKYVQELSKKTNDFEKDVIKNIQNAVNSINELKNDENNKTDKKNIELKEREQEIKESNKKFLEDLTTVKKDTENLEEIIERDMPQDGTRQNDPYYPDYQDYPDRQDTTLPLTQETITHLNEVHNAMKRKRDQSTSKRFAPLDYNIDTDYNIASQGVDPILIQQHGGGISDEQLENLQKVLGGYMEYYNAHTKSIKIIRKNLLQSFNRDLLINNNEHTETLKYFFRFVLNIDNNTNEDIFDRLRNPIKNLINICRDILYKENIISYNHIINDYLDLFNNLINDYHELFNDDEYVFSYFISTNKIIKIKQYNTKLIEKIYNPDIIFKFDLYVSQIIKDIILELSLLNSFLQTKWNYIKKRYKKFLEYTQPNNENLDSSKVENLDTSIVEKYKLKYDKLNLLSENSSMYNLDTLLYKYIYSSLNLSAINLKTNAQLTQLQLFNKFMKLLEDYRKIIVVQRNNYKKIILYFLKIVIDALKILRQDANITDDLKNKGFKYHHEIEKEIMCDEIITNIIIPLCGSGDSIEGDINSFFTVFNMESINIDDRNNIQRSFIIRSGKDYFHTYDDIELDKKKKLHTGTVTYYSPINVDNNVQLESTNTIRNIDTVEFMSSFNDFKNNFKRNKVTKYGNMQQQIYNRFAYSKEQIVLSPFFDKLIKLVFPTNGYIQNVYINLILRFENVFNDIVLMDYIFDKFIGGDNTIVIDKDDSDFHDIMSYDSVNDVDHITQELNQLFNNTSINTLQVQEENISKSFQNIDITFFNCDGLLPRIINNMSFVSLINDNYHDDIDKNTFNKLMKFIENNDNNSEDISVKDQNVIDKLVDMYLYDNNRKYHVTEDYMDKYILIDNINKYLKNPLLVLKKNPSLQQINLNEIFDIIQRKEEHEFYHYYRKILYSYKLLISTKLITLNNSILNDNNFTIIDEDIFVYGSNHDAVLTKHSIDKQIYDYNIIIGFLFYFDIESSNNIETSINILITKINDIKTFFTTKNNEPQLTDNEKKKYDDIINMSDLLIQRMDTVITNYESIIKTILDLNNTLTKEEAKKILTRKYNYIYIWFVYNEIYGNSLEYQDNELIKYIMDDKKQMEEEFHNKLKNLHKVKIEDETNPLNQINLLDIFSSIDLKDDEKINKISSDLEKFEGEYVSRINNSTVELENKILYSAFPERRLKQHENYRKSVKELIDRMSNVEKIDRGIIRFGYYVSDNNFVVLSSDEDGIPGKYFKDINDDWYMVTAKDFTEEILREVYNLSVRNTYSQDPIFNKDDNQSIVLVTMNALDNVNNSLLNPKERYLEGNQKIVNEIRRKKGNDKKIKGMTDEQIFQNVVRKRDIEERQTQEKRLKDYKELQIENYQIKSLEDKIREYDNKYDKLIDAKLRNNLIEVTRKIMTQTYAAPSRTRFMGLLTDDMAEEEKNKKQQHGGEDETEEEKISLSKYTFDEFFELTIDQFIKKNMYMKNFISGIQFSLAYSPFINQKNNLYPPGIFNEEVKKYKNIIEEKPRYGGQGNLMTLDFFKPYKSHGKFKNMGEFIQPLYYYGDINLLPDDVNKYFIQSSEDSKKKSNFELIDILKQRDACYNRLNELITINAFLDRHIYITEEAKSILLTNEINTIVTYVSDDKQTNNLCYDSRMSMLEDIFQEIQKNRSEIDNINLLFKLHVLYDTESIGYKQTLFNGEPAFNTTPKTLFNNLVNKTTNVVTLRELAEELIIKPIKELMNENISNNQIKMYSELIHYHLLMFIFEYNLPTVFYHKYEKTKNYFDSVVLTIVDAIDFIDYLINNSDLFTQFDKYNADTENKSIKLIKKLLEKKFQLRIYNNKISNIQKGGGIFEWYKNLRNNKIPDTEARIYSNVVLNNIIPNQNNDYNPFEISDEIGFSVDKMINNSNYNEILLFYDNMLGINKHIKNYEGTDYTKLKDDLINLKNEYYKIFDKKGGNSKLSKHIEEVNKQNQDTKQIANSGETWINIPGTFYKILSMIRYKGEEKPQTIQELEKYLSPGEKKLGKDEIYTNFDVNLYNDEKVCKEIAEMYESLVIIFEHFHNQKMKTGYYIKRIDYEEDKISDILEMFSKLRINVIKLSHAFFTLNIVYTNLKLILQSPKNKLSTQRITYISKTLGFLEFIQKNIFKFKVIYLTNSKEQLRNSVVSYTRYIVDELNEKQNKTQPRPTFRPTTRYQEPSISDSSESDSSYQPSDRSSDRDYFELGSSNSSVKFNDDRSVYSKDSLEDQNGGRNLIKSILGESYRKLIKSWRKRIRGEINIFELSVDMLRAKEAAELNINKQGSSILNFAFDDISFSEYLDDINFLIDLYDKTVIQNMKIFKEDILITFKKSITDLGIFEMTTNRNVCGSQIENSLTNISKIIDTEQTRLKDEKEEKRKKIEEEKEEKRKKIDEERRIIMEERLKNLQIREQELLKRGDNWYKKSRFGIGTLEEEDARVDAAIKQKEEKAKEEEAKSKEIAKESENIEKLLKTQTTLSDTYYDHYTDSYRPIPVNKDMDIVYLTNDYINTNKVNFTRLDYDTKKKIFEVITKDRNNRLKAQDKKKLVESMIEHDKETIANALKEVGEPKVPEVIQNARFPQPDSQTNVQQTNVQQTNVQQTNVPQTVDSTISGESIYEDQGEKSIKYTLKPYDSTVTAKLLKGKDGKDFIVSTNVDKNYTSGWNTIENLAKKLNNDKEFNNN